MTSDNPQTPPSTLTDASIDEASADRPPSDVASQGSSRSWIAAVAVILVLGGGAAAWTMVGGEDADDASVTEEPEDDDVGFQAYRGTPEIDEEPEPDDDTNHSDTDEEPAAAAEPGLDEDPAYEPSQPSSSDDDIEEDEEEERQLGMDRDEDPRYRDADVIRREPDGENILEDRSGDSISQREAQERIERELDSMENADEDFERRLRRRDAELNSRVLQPRRGEQPEVIPGVEVNEDIEERISDQFPSGEDGDGGDED